MQHVSGRLVPAFTPIGFEVVTAPKHIFEKLKAEVEKGLANWDSLPTESDVEAIYCPENPKFIHMWSVAAEVHKELKEMHEAWGGVKLVPTSVYGVRMYQNRCSFLIRRIYFS